MPCLAVDGLGYVGLPLNKRQAEDLIFFAVRANHCHLEIQASKVTFHSAGWKKWLANVVVPQVCKTLGVNALGTAAPRMELQKVVISTTGSRCLHYLLTLPLNSSHSLGASVSYYTKRKFFHKR